MHISLACGESVEIGSQGMARPYLIFYSGLPWWLSGKESTCQCRRHRFDPRVKKIPWRRKWALTLSMVFSYLENPMDRGAWWATVYSIARHSDMTVIKQQQKQYFTLWLGAISSP